MADPEATLAECECRSLRAENKRLRDALANANLTRGNALTRAQCAERLLGEALAKRLERAAGELGFAWGEVKHGV